MTSGADIRIIESLERGNLEATDNALVLIAACIHEALEAVGEWEFSIRIGFTIEEARDLKGQIESILEARGSNRP